MNTATMQAVVASTARPISEVASCAASRALLPLARCRKMFSMTTMASSMRMPIDSDSPSIVMLLNVNPMKSMNQKVATTDVGIATALMSVERKSRRKKRMMITARMAPNTRSNFTSLIECSM